MEKYILTQLMKLWAYFRSDPLACVVEMEYEAFQISKTANLYKAAVLKKVRNGCY